MSDNFEDELQQAPEQAAKNDDAPKIGDSVFVNVENIDFDDWHGNDREGTIVVLHQDGSADIRIPDTVRAELEGNRWVAVEIY